MPGLRPQGADTGERFGSCKGDMTELRSLRLVCQSCGSRDFDAKVFLRDLEPEAWLEWADGLAYKRRRAAF